MLSGNGRHRRPRQAPALFVAAGVTGSAIAIPLMGASGASAADGTVWDKVAKCESGGSWSADAGNGYYGGLQLTQEDWEQYGGLDYAPSADQASRSQQISVAEKILADRGPGAWPTCGLLSGLSKKSGVAKVDTGVGGGSSGSNGSSDSSGKSNPSLSNGLGLSGSPQGSGNSSDSSDSSGPSDSPTAEPDAADSPSAAPVNPSPSTPSPGKGGDSVKPDTSPEDAASVPSAPDTSPSIASEWGNSDNYGYVAGVSALVDTGALGAGRHRGASAVEDPADSRAVASSGRHASRGGSGARADMSGSYTVRSGDSLESIADSLGLQGGWSALYDANRQAIGDDPDRVVAGQALDIPAETAQK
ncbi:peptigoglycan-binding protein LysM [Streptomyces sp. NTH33]|uniref:LysM peptidoglycan-binding domain-containing protein n=1 Tax=Streptomyces sp. NTH33 TaxID=1735453 RepID=UPI000DA799D6|nr:transglycosylase family protein [Streptomyces sp. NTH33]PZG86214.1 peptigoglycan-binding protein LysM [Streptomyces sp. NTH33]